MQAINTVIVEQTASQTSVENYKTDDKPAAVKDGSSFLSIIEKMLTVAKEGNASDGTEKNAKNVSTATAKEESAAGLGKLLKNKKNSLGENQDLQSTLDKNQSAKNEKDLDFLNVKNLKGKNQNNFKDVNSLNENLNSSTESEILLNQGTFTAKDEKSILGNELNSSKKLGKSKDSEDSEEGESLVSALGIVQSDKNNSISDVKDVNSLSSVSSQKKLSLKDRIKVIDERTVDFSKNQLTGNQNSDAKNSPEVSMSIGSKESFAERLNTFTEKKGESGNLFSKVLSQQIQESVGQIVQQGTIILKDFNQGTIKLSLNPESLGNVKIQLKLSENNVTGSILVASEDALNAFKENLDGLKTAFMQTGFETAGFDLGYGSGNEKHSENNKKEQKTDFTLADTFSVEGKNARQNAVNAYEVPIRGTVDVVA